MSLERLRALAKRTTRDRKRREKLSKLATKSYQEGRTQTPAAKSLPQSIELMRTRRGE